MIPKSLLYKLVRLSDRRIIDEGSKSAMNKRAKGNPKLAVVIGSPDSQVEQILGEKRKPITIRQPLSTLGSKELEFLKKQFEAKVEEDKKRAPRKKYEHFTRDGEGPERKVDPKPEDGTFRRKSEGRKDGVMPKRKVPKLKLEVWNQKTMLAFFRQEFIHADRTQGWFITFNTPSRKMTVTDQLDLMLAHQDTEYEIQINRGAKHMIIDSLEGNPPE